MGVTDPMRIHETVIKDIIDFTLDMEDIDIIKMTKAKNSGYSIKSVANATSNLTLVFPVLCATTISGDIAAMINKAIERKCVSMMQILFAACSTNDSWDAMEYLARFHTNLKGNLTIDDYIDTMERIGESANIQFGEGVIDLIRKDMRNLNYTLPDSLSERAISDYIVSNEGYGENKYTVHVEAIRPDQFTVDRHNTRSAKDIADVNKNTQEYFNKMLLDTDVKKSNELTPSLILVRFYTEKSQIARQFIVGIKARLIPIDSYDIIERIKVKNEDHKGLLKFIRATTREISFFKDFLLAVDRAKLDALSYSKNSNNSRIWKILERRALKGNFNTGFQLKNDSTRIATLVISEEEVEYLKKDGVDIEHATVVRTIMEAYGLLSFVIVNETMEVARFMFDDESGMFDDVSFRNLERETSGGEYRKIVNLMSKMR